jgi:Bacterial regulatory protein, Fis family
MAKDKNTQTTHPKKALMIEALKKCVGNVSEACEVVGIGRKTHYNWVNDDAEYKEAVEAINETSIDHVESQLVKLINGFELPETKVFCTKDGDIVTHDMQKQYPPDTAAIIFYLKTKGKHRGYTGDGNKVTVNDQDGKTITVEYSS